MNKFSFGTIEKLDDKHDIGLFDCGEISLNDYLQKHALVNQKLGLAQTHVAVSSKIIGFYSLTAASVGHDGLPKHIVRGLPKYNIPLVLIARLGVDISMQGKGVGTSLLKDIVLRSIDVANTIGVRAISVNAKNEQVASWYLKFGFKPSHLNSKDLFLLIKEAENYIKLQDSELEENKVINF